MTTKPQLMTTRDARALASALKLIVGGRRPAALVGSARHVEEHPNVSLCLACGGHLPLVLQVTGSIRCQDCRDEMAPLRDELVEPHKHHEQAA